jgi:acylphosphatase
MWPTRPITSSSESRDRSFYALPHRVGRHVQGVGFRPFVKNLADSLSLPGITFNTANGLMVECETDTHTAAKHFLDTIQSNAPAAARIETSFLERLREPAFYHGFQIIPSAPRDDRFTLTEPDLPTLPTAVFMPSPPRVLLADLGCRCHSTWPSMRSNLDGFSR